MFEREYREVVIQKQPSSGLTALETAERLGVEIATVYAYASRGSLTRRIGPDGRRSNYDPDQVELLARKGRPRSIRRAPGAVDVVIGTTISQIGDGWIRYRCHDAIELATERSFEDVARLLWSGAFPDRAMTSAPEGPSGSGARRAAVHATSTLGQRASSMARLTVAVAAASSTMDPVSVNASETHTVAERMIDAMLASLTLNGSTPLDGASVAKRLWVHCSPLEPTPARIDAMNRALVLLAEHELATSTLAVRVAASTGAGLAPSLLAGLGTLSGPLHGGASARVHRRLLEGPLESVEALSNDSSTNALEGFGHMVHRSGDPRYEPLMEAVAKIASPTARRVIEVDRAHARRRGAPPPNVDSALGALGFVARTDIGATDAIFAIARTAGWCAHAIEEADELPLRYRGRTLFRGPRPD